MSPLAMSHNSCIDVWYENLYFEFRNIRRIMNDYPYVAMDTEFPGCVAKPYGTFRTSAEYQYYGMKANVDLTKVIQVGVTFFNENGETPQPTSSWQFNFSFNQNTDMGSSQSIALLESSGIQFPRLAHYGIQPEEFCELLISSGLVLSDRVKWLSFHSGYDFGYMVKMLTNNRLPETDDEFFAILNEYFPYIYDVKYMMKSCRSLKGGLQELATNLEIQRKGPQHTAGSDSLMTGEAFFKLKTLFFEGSIDDAAFCGHLYGFGPGYSNTATATSAASLAAVASAAAVAANSASSPSVTSTPAASGTATEERSCSTPKAAKLSAAASESSASKEGKDSVKDKDSQSSNGSNGCAKFTVESGLSQQSGETNGELVAITVLTSSKAGESGGEEGGSTDNLLNNNASPVAVALDAGCAGGDSSSQS